MNYPNCIVYSVNNLKKKKDLVKFENPTQQKPERICVHKSTTTKQAQQKTK